MVGPWHSSYPPSRFYYLPRKADNNRSTESTAAPRLTVGCISSQL
jgi:hypothetical protein